MKTKIRKTQRRPDLLPELRAAASRGENGQLAELLTEFPIEQILETLWSDLENKLASQKFEVIEARLAAEADGVATTKYRGQEIEHEVPGLLAIVGQFRMAKNGETVKVSRRFISHPFWQWVKT